MAAPALSMSVERGQVHRHSWSNAPIGVFDSGIGGLSVVRALRSALPAEDIIYFADTKYCPYGLRDEQFILDRTQAIAQRLIDRGAKLVVIACNTASAVALEAVRAGSVVSIVGLEPAVKPAAKLTRSGRIGVFATPRTIASSRLARLIERHAADIEVELVSAPGWVEQVETGIADPQSARALIEPLVRPVVENGADVLVLGCTHFPFLEPLIREYTGDAVEIIDSGDAIARRTKDLLAQDSLAHPAQAHDGAVTLTTTSPDVESVSRLAARLLDMPVAVQFDPV